jgi:hypothetical protein
MELRVLVRQRLLCRVNIRKQCSKVSIVLTGNGCVSSMWRCAVESRRNSCFLDPFASARHFPLATCNSVPFPYSSTSFCFDITLLSPCISCDLSKICASSPAMTADAPGARPVLNGYAIPAVNCNRYVHTLFAFRWIPEHTLSFYHKIFGYLQTGYLSEFGPCPNNPCCFFFVKTHNRNSRVITPRPSHTCSLVLCC